MMIIRMITINNDSILITIMMLAMKDVIIHNNIANENNENECIDIISQHHHTMCTVMTCLPP